SSGIGRAIALELGLQGANVCVNYHSGGDQAAAVVAEITSRGQRAIAYGANVASSAEVQQMVETTCQQLGQINVCVNNAGIEKQASFLDVTERDWDLVLDINL